MKQNIYIQKRMERIKRDNLIYDIENFFLEVFYLTLTFFLSVEFFLLLHEVVK